MSFLLLQAAELRRAEAEQQGEAAGARQKDQNPKNSMRRRQSARTQVLVKRMMTLTGSQRPDEDLGHAAIDSISNDDI